MPAGTNMYDFNGTAVILSLWSSRSRHSRHVQKFHSNVLIFRSRNSRSFHAHHLLFHGLFTIFHGSSVHCQMQLQHDLHGSNVKSHTLPLISSKFSWEPFKSLSGYASSQVSQKFRPELPGKWVTITQWTIPDLFTTLKLYRSLTHRPRGWKCRHPARYRRANGSFASCEGRQIDGSWVHLHCCSFSHWIDTSKGVKKGDFFAPKNGPKTEKKGAP